MFFLGVPSDIFHSIRLENLQEFLQVFMHLFLLKNLHKLSSELSIKFLRKAYISSVNVPEILYFIHGVLWEIIQERLQKSLSLILLKYLSRTFQKLP